jgi:hypothetical protein
MLTISQRRRCIVSRADRHAAGGRMAEDILIPLGGMVMIAWIVYTVVTGIQGWYQRRVQAQFQSKMLDKIGSVSELGQFLNTEAGTRFLKGLTSDASGPHGRILRAVQSGLVLGVLGIGLFIYGWFSPTIPGEAKHATNAVATILLSLGVGFLVSALTSYRLSKQLGLLSSDGPSR